VNEASSDRFKRTIVGGQPRDRGQGRAGIPRGIEVLIKKASLDPAFYRLLLEQRAAAAHEIALELTPAETAILDSVPEAQLQAMIDRTTVPDVQRRAFLGTLGAAMLAAVVAGCTPPTRTETPVPVTGVRPEEETATPTPVVVEITVEIEKGIRPDDLTRYAERTPTPAWSTPTPWSTSTPTPEPSSGQDDPEKPPTPVVRGTRPDLP